MRIIISTLSRFHAFSLAEQLQSQGCLSKLIVGYFNQNKNAKDYNIDKIKVVKNIIPMIIIHLPNVIPFSQPLNIYSQFIGHEMYDLWARTKVEPCDIFVGWSSLSLNSFRRASALGAVTVLERGSSHMLFQKEILEDEYERFGIKSQVVSNKLLDKELQEYEEVDYISIPSDFVRQSFVERGIPEKKLIQVPYGVNLNHFMPVLKKDSIFRIMHIGGSLRKGTHYLFQAMNELNLKNSELMFIGKIEDPIKPFIEKYKGAIKVFQSIPHLQLYKYYSQSSVYVIPSIEEGLAMVMMEAMACGNPVICSTNSGGKDIIRDGKEGFVIPIRDIKTLKDKIQYLYENEQERKEMSLNALNRAKEFNWERYGERIIKNYRSILKFKGC